MFTNTVGGVLAVVAALLFGGGISVESGQWSRCRRPVGGGGGGNTTTTDRHLRGPFTAQPSIG
jgi:hypothetical protein